VFAAVAQERRQLASLLNDLDEAQLATPSLCLGWDIKTVAMRREAWGVGSMSWHAAGRSRGRPRSSPVFVNTPRQRL
jgi:Mycothiol maleylpyruvate isomerase N-terminal domain